LRYNLELNPAYREALGFDVAMTLPEKLAYLTDRVLALRRNSFLLLTYLVCWLCLAGRRRRYAFEQRLVLALLPFLLLAALSATPSWYQYFYPLVPFMALGVAYAAADHESMRLRPLAAAAVAALLVGSVAGLRHCADAFRHDGDRWTATAVHATGKRIAELAGSGPVLTLAPTLPLEGGARIYPALATGPFAYRTASLVPAADRARVHLAGPQELERLLAAEPPAAVLVGAETDAAANVEYALVRYATVNDYEPVRVGLDLVLWVKRKPGAPT